MFKFESMESKKQNNEQYSTRFETVEGKNELVGVVECLFEEIIKPIYGDQALAIERIRKGVDRTTKLFFENENPIGVLVVKTLPNDEFASVGAPNGIEIKTLFVIDPEKNKGKGYGKKLLIESLVQAVKSKADYLVVTVSENKEESLGFFQAKGFEIKKAMPDKYTDGVIEYLLIKGYNN